MTDDELESVWSAYESRVDPEAVERARDGAGPDQVVCHECARPFGQITEQHVQTHGMTLEEYKSTHPEAPIYPESDDRKPGRELGFDHPEETRQKIGQGVRRCHERGVYE